jgi:phosphatidate phosphatase LPIN
MFDGPSKQKGRPCKEYEDFESPDGETGEEEIGRRTGSFFLEDLRWISDCGATLNASRDDTSLFVFPINDKKVVFQLSLVSFEDVKNGVQLAQLFNKFLIEFERFLDDESVIQDPRLVIRWGEDQYVSSTFLFFV